MLKFRGYLQLDRVMLGKGKVKHDSSSKNTDTSKPTGLETKVLQLWMTRALLFSKVNNSPGELNRLLEFDAPTRG